MANPILTNFEKSFSPSERMTIPGVAIKSMFFMFLTMLAATFIWKSVSAETLNVYLGVGLIGALISGFVAVFLPHTTSVSGSIYSICQGILLGAISAAFESQYPGIVLTAVVGTFAAFLTTMFAYTVGVVTVTDQFLSGVITATLGVFVFYSALILLSLFGIYLPVNDGILGILISTVVILIVAANLVIDFWYIDEGVRTGVHKSQEWYAAFGLHVTILWLYLEILQLLAKIQNSKK